MGEMLRNVCARVWKTSIAVCTHSEMPLSVRCSHDRTHPECVSVEGAWVMTDPDWEEDRACWAARLQLGPNMGPWDWGCCRGWAWGWCSGGWGCGCWSWSWGLSWFIQDGPLWESICGEERERQSAATTEGPLAGEYLLSVRSGGM